MLQAVWFVNHFKVLAQKSSVIGRIWDNSIVCPLSSVVLCSPCYFYYSTKNLGLVTALSITQYLSVIDLLASPLCVLLTLFVNWDNTVIPALVTQSEKKNDSFLKLFSNITNSENAFRRSLQNCFPCGPGQADFTWPWGGKSV